MNDRLEIILQIHAFGQAVSGDKDTLSVNGPVGERCNARSTRLRRQLTCDDLDLYSPEFVSKMCSHVMGSLNEPAENDGAIAIPQESPHLRYEEGEFGVT